MGWETRGGGLYYYRKHRLDGRAVSQYCGRGPPARLAASQDEEQQAERQAGRIQRRKDQERDRAIDAYVEAVCRAVQRLTAGALLVSGCHTHKGQWRQKRNATER